MKLLYVDVKNRFDETPLHCAAGEGFSDVVKELIRRGANIAARDGNFYRTPLHLAAKGGYLGVVKELVKVDINARDKNGDTPLHLAAKGGRLDVVGKLIENNADINIRNYYGNSPLYKAAEEGYLSTVKKFMENGAHISIKNRYGRTPLDIARDKGHDSVVQYLEGIERERGKPVQRKRRHHHGDHDRHHSHLSRESLAIDSSNQPGIATSSTARPSSWVNDLFNWVKSSIGELLSSNTTSSILQIDRQIDVDGAIMLIDLLIRKVTGQKYISLADQSISLLEAQGYALNIIEKFEKVLNETAIKSGISVTNLNFDPLAVQSATVRKIRNGKFSEIAKTLYSIAKEACPEFKQTDKFLDNLRSNLKEEKETVMLQQKVEKPSKDLLQKVIEKMM